MFSFLFKSILFCEVIFACVFCCEKNSRREGDIYSDCVSTKLLIQKNSFSFENFLKKVLKNFLFGLLFVVRELTY